MVSILQTCKGAYSGRLEHRTPQRPLFILERGIRAVRQNQTAVETRVYSMLAGPRVSRSTFLGSSVDREHIAVCRFGGNALGVFARVVEEADDSLCACQRRGGEDDVQF
jgi:hypothetical protein